MSDSDALAALEAVARPLSPDWSAEALAEALPTGDVVALGEATHGSRTVRQAQRRLVEFLVRERGLRTVALETPLSATVPIDRYVAGDRDAVRERVASLDWIWATEGVVELLAALRAFNDGRPEGDRVRVKGVDLRSPATPAPALRSFFRRVDPAVADDDEQLATLASFEPGDDPEDRDAHLDAAERAARTLRDRLDEHRGDYVAATTESAWATARRLTTVAEQACDWARVRHRHAGPHEAGMAARDRHMAANVQWCRDRDAGDGVVLLAHHAHVKRGTFDDGTAWTDARTLGDRLAAADGPTYRPVGVEITGGELRALSAGRDTDGPVTVDLPSPPPDTLPGTVAATDASRSWVDPALAADDDRLAPLCAPGSLLSVGSMYDRSADGGPYRETDLAASFDGLLFVGESSPTRPVEC